MTEKSKMKELNESHEPKKIFFRDKQIGELKQVCNSFVENNNAINKILQGTTGSGKTTIAKKIFKENRDSHIYISCADLKTSKRVFKKLYPSSFFDCVERFKKNPKIIIFDEINKVNNIIEFFDDLNHFFRETNCPIILITNRVDLTRKMNIDAKRTLGFLPIIFPSYNAEEIRMILEGRIKEARESQSKIPEIPEGTIQFISALTGGDGSLKDAFTLLRLAVNSKDFSLDSIRKNLDNVRAVETCSWIDSLNETELAVLKEMLSLCYSKYDFSADRIPCEFSYRELVFRFTRKYKRRPQRVSQIIKKFENEFLIESEDEWLGRKGGKNKIIRFLSEEDINLIHKKVFLNKSVESIIWENAKQLPT